MAISFATEAIRIFAPIGDRSHDESNPVSRTVDVQPASAPIAWEQFGAEVKNGYIVFDEASAAGYYQEFSRIDWNGRSFIVVAVPRNWSALTPAANVQVLMEERRG